VFSFNHFCHPKQCVLQVFSVRLKHLLSDKQSSSPQRRIIFYLWPVWSFHAFSYCRIKGKIAGKNLSTQNLFDFLKTFIRKLCQKDSNCYQQQCT